MTAQVHATEVFNFVGGALHFRMSKAATRQGKIGVQADITLDKWKALRHLVTETRRSANDLIDEEISLLIEKYSPQAQPTRNGKKTAHRTKSARELRHD